MNQTRQRIKLATRASKLARWQAEWVAQQLEQQGVDVELVFVATSGDGDLRPLASIGGQGLFTKEIQRAVLDGRAHIAVHSLKDLPTDPVDGLQLAAVPQRDSPNDVLVTSSGRALDELPQHARVGTGSQRRRSQLLRARSDILVADIRGNVDTRLEKLSAGDYDAIVLAEAGLRRLELDQWVTTVLPTTTMMPAVGQGALGIECRRDDRSTIELLESLNHRETQQSVIAERTLLASLRAGCSAPLGGWARHEHGQLRLDAIVLSLDGRQHLTATAADSDPVNLGKSVAEDLCLRGADVLIEDARS